MPQASSQPSGRTDPTSAMTRPTRGSRINGTSPTTAGTADPVRPSTQAARFRPPRRTARSSARRERGPAWPCLDRPPLLRAAATAVRRRSRLSLARLAPCVRGRLAALLTPLAIGRGMRLLPVAPRAVWSGFLTLAGDAIGVTSRFDRSLGGHRIQLLVRALVDLGGSARAIVDRVRSRGRPGCSRRSWSLAFAGRPDSGRVGCARDWLSTRRG
jgi:hypothetical protein